MKNRNFSLLKPMLFLMVVMILSSCEKYKKEIEQLNVSRDSIQTIVDERNNQVLDYIISFNEIQQNLDSIKQVQKIVGIEMGSTDVENQVSEKERILNDIARINNLLNQNKKLVASLQKKLKDSNLNSKELEQMIQRMVLQVEEKDREIALLNSEVANLKIDITELNLRIEVLAEESTQKSSTIEAQQNKMNEAFYCFGTRDELIENGVVEKTGGFLGIGKTVKLKSDFNHQYFTTVDQRQFREVILMAPKARLLSVHADSSYHFTGTEKMVENLVIDDADAFWKLTNYLIVLVE
ncbi:MAG: hypothetical protein JXR22_02675 [Prolixibacteraceae bacterium]|nr:hypothetical protein [Prolixibacteraceae bacterium]